MNGYYGLFCNQSCANCSEVSGQEMCHRSTGVCTNGCKLGFFNDRCSKLCSFDCQSFACSGTERNCTFGCIQGLFGSDCTSKCNPNCVNDLCERTSGECTVGCRSGFYGTLCDRSCKTAGCASGSCDRQTGACQTSCLAGYFGPYCNSTCPRCDYLSCDKTTGACIGDCKAGFYGSNCELQCSQNCNGSSCDRSSGRCTNSCSAGWYGEQCNQQCSINCNQGFCNRVSGNCDSCKDGHYGVKCELFCSTNCINPFCNFTDGTCVDCASGWWGNACNVRCPDNCENLICSQNTGNCLTCKPGFYGTDCRLTCSGCAPFNGESNCAQFDGTCLNKCNPGFYGSMCTGVCNNKCKNNLCVNSATNCSEGCKSGFYGQDCQSICSANCMNSECNKISGACLQGCKPRFFGQTYLCTSQCPVGCYDCTSDTSCLSCKPNRYGTKCIMQCSDNCKLPTDGTRVCDTSTGKCVLGCRDGYYGENCNKKCSSNCNNIACERDTGRCIGICKATFYGFFCNESCNGCETVGGSSCEQPTGRCLHGCVTGFYGTYCRDQCSSNCQNQKCETSSDNCLEGCITGKYGFDCKQECDSKCFGGKCARSTGSCELCHSGFEGPTCSQSLVSSENDNLPLIVGLSSGGGFLLIIIIVTVLCMQQLRSRKLLEREMAVKRFQEQNGWTFDDERLTANQFDKMSAFNGSMHGGSVHGSIHGSQFHGSQYHGDTRHSEINYPYEDEDGNDQFRSRGGSTSGNVYDNELVSGIGDDIALTDFPQYVCKMRVTDGAYERAHKKLQVGLIASCLEAQKEENVKKNRYKNIFAWPTEHTVDDFWTMIWQEHCSTVAMLTNLVECGVNKCYPYWPDENTESSHAGIMIKCKSKDVFADFIIRSLTISKEGEERSLTHCQYSTWPDRGVPQYVTPLVEYLHMIRSIQRNDFPMLVHCSAGCGRTGSFIAVHYLCEEALKERRVNVFECVKRMREQRVNMVQTPNMRSMLQLSDKAESAHLPENLPKNRTNIVANDSSRVFLWSTVQGCNDYINAIYIPDGKYWADPGESVVCGPFRLTVKTVSEDEHCICRTMELHYRIGV
uniref:protein-tyrosine-phosphatase n=1 Tax=Magallana gigas TaxID=29159 RepID=K1QW76_MAGGI